jgi:hypothetical protein
VADPTQKPASFRKCLARLTGDKGERCDHIFKYRIQVVTADGQDYGLRLSAGINAKTPKADIGRLKRRLCLHEHEVDIETILTSWGPDDLRSFVKAHLTREHLEQRRGG